MASQSRSKILIISSEFPPGPGGIGNHAYNLAKNLQDSDIVEVSVMADTNFTSESELIDFDKNNKFKIYRIFRSKPIIVTYLKRIIMAGKLIPQHDKILFSGKFPLWLAGIYRRLFSKKEFIAIVHGSELDLPNQRMKKFTHDSLIKCDKIISVSRYTQQFLPAQNGHQKRKIIANGIDLSESKLPGDHTDIVKTSTLSLLTVGNVTPRKGQKNIINALPTIKKIFPKAHYHVVGLPTIKDELTEFAQMKGVLENITFHGKVLRNELLAHYKKCDIFMMLSDHTPSGDFEGFGIAVLEANLWGKPSIGSRNSGIADAIDDGVTGILVDQHNVEEIAEAIKKIYDDYDKFSRNAYEWALKHDWSKISQKYYEVIFDK